MLVNKPGSPFFGGDHARTRTRRVTSVDGRLAPITDPGNCPGASQVRGAMGTALPDFVFGACMVGAPPPCDRSSRSACAEPPQEQDRDETAAVNAAMVSVERRDHRAALGPATAVAPLVTERSRWVAGQRGQRPRSHLRENLAARCGPVLSRGRSIAWQHSIKLPRPAPPRGLRHFRA
jgi:hypothetical protein